MYSYNIVHCLYHVIPSPSCPDCDSARVVKNGMIHNGKQNHLCKDCGCQFVKDPQSKIINDATKALIDKLLLGKLPLAGVAQVVDVSEPWLQQFVNTKYQKVPRQATVKTKKRPINSEML